MAAAKIVVSSTKHYGSWKNAVAAVPHLKKGNWVSIAAYARWKAEIATPAFRTFLANKTGMGELVKELTDGWSQVSGN